MGDVTEMPPRRGGGKSEGRKCNAKKSRGGNCSMPAGHGTDHPGYGRCKRHTGSTPAGVKAAAKEAMIIEGARLASNVEIEPGEALLEEVRRSAGFVRWMQERLAAWDSEEHSEAEKMGLLVQMGDMTWSKAALVDVYQTERKHLARTCKMALDAGVAERAIRLAEDQGRLLANAIQGILRDLNLDAEQQASAPGVVRKHLMLVASE